MKTCPFCAEEVQDAATVCRFCNRSLNEDSTAPPAPPVESTATRTVRVLVLVLFFGLILMWVFGRGGAEKERLLDVSGAKGRLGMSVTNREPSAITDCLVKVYERGRPDEWFARVPRIGVMETVTVGWAQFVGPNGHAMPSYVGASARHISVMCLTSDGVRRDAGMAFSD